MTALPLFRTLLTCALLAAGGSSAAASTGAGPAFAGLAQPQADAGEEADEAVRLAQADCSAAAAQAAAQTGGQVLSVSASNQGGQTVCVVTVLIPGQGGERPRRTTITLPG